MVAEPVSSEAGMVDIFAESIHIRFLGFVVLNPGFAPGISAVIVLSVQGRSHAVLFVCHILIVDTSPDKRERTQLGHFVVGTVDAVEVKSLRCAVFVYIEGDGGDSRGGALHLVLAGASMGREDGDHAVLHRIVRTVLVARSRAVEIVITHGLVFSFGVAGGIDSCKRKFRVGISLGRSKNTRGIDVGVGIAVIGLGDVVFVVIDHRHHHVAVVEQPGGDGKSPVVGGVGHEFPFGLQTPCSHALAGQEVMFLSSGEV